jgi:hypothetical protein
MALPGRIILLILLLWSLNVRAEITGPGIDSLGFMAGDWKAVRYFKDPRNNWVRADEKSVTFYMTGGGKFITADIQQQDDQFHIIISWDQYQSMYRAVVMDYSTGLLDVYTGKPRSGKLELSNGKETFNVADGKKVLNRYVISQNDAGFAIETYMFVAGEERDWTQITKTEYSAKQ